MAPKVGTYIFSKERQVGNAVVIFRVLSTQMYSDLRALFPSVAPGKLQPSTYKTPPGSPKAEKTLPKVTCRKP